jgi:glutathione-regulated potassium-efflux system ancillary protein KefC
MNQLLVLATLWIGLAVISTMLSSWLRLAAALTEIIIGALAQLVILKWFGSNLLDPGQIWVQFLAGTGAIMLTFLAGAELDPVIFKQKWKEASAVGIISFIAPFLGCAALAYYWFHWSLPASWLTGIALSTTSVAVVYAVMLEFGLNATNYGKTILAACFITDLGTVLALGFMFAPFSAKTLIFFGATISLCIILPTITRYLFKWFGNRPSEFEAKYLLLCLFGLGALAAWAGSEAVLPAYLLGMSLAGTAGKDHTLIRRLRTLTLGLLTPFYFIRAGSLVSIPALIAAPVAIFVLFMGKIITKIIGVYPVTRLFGSANGEGIYTTLLMSTGLTFGSISALYGLSHNIIDADQYSYLIAVVIGSAIIPTIIANMFFLPHHVLHKEKPSEPSTMHHEVNQEAVDSN